MEDFCKKVNKLFGYLKYFTYLCITQMKKILDWFKESNRGKHLLYAIPIGFIDLELAIGVASGMEFKDKLYGNKWDWIDWSLTVLGGSIGFLIKLITLKFTNYGLWM